MGNNALVAALFRAACRDPFGLAQANLLDRWFQHVVEHFPLWTFQAWAHAKLVTAPHLSDEPLQAMMRSVCTDEGLPVGQRVPLRPLEKLLDERRYWLVDNGRFGGSLGSLPTQARGPHAAQTVTVPGPFSGSAFNRLRPLRAPEYANDDGGPDYTKAFERLGRELVERIEAWVRGRSTTERRRARTEVDNYVRALCVQLGAPRGRGAPRVGPSKTVLAKLAREGAKLFRTVWQPVGEGMVVPTPAALKRFRTLGVSRSDSRMWALRLALPVLSAQETAALSSQAAEAFSTRWGPRPTAWRFAVWVLAHRLRLDAAQVARKASGSEAQRYFRARSSPIPAALS